MLTEKNGKRENMIVSVFILKNDSHSSFCLILSSLMCLGRTFFFYLLKQHREKCMNFALCEKKINAGLEQGTAVNRRCSNSKLADAKFKKEREKKSCQ